MVSTASDGDVALCINEAKRYNDDRGRTSIHFRAISVKEVIFDCERRFAVTTSFNAVSNSCDWGGRVLASTCVI